jgi:hypothetical protein
MKKIFFIIAALAALQAARAQDTVFHSAHELGVSAGTGLSTLLYKSVGIDGAVKAGAGGVFSIDYAYSFRPDWAIVTGISFLYTQQQAESKSISQSVEQTYIFDAPTTTTLLLNSTLEKWTEKQSASFLQIPIMIRYQSTLKGKTQYYVALGGKLSFNVLNTYNAYADVLVTTGNFDEFKQVFTNVPNHNFTTTSGVQYKGKGTNFVPDFSIAFEAGVKQTITSGTRLYAGLFCEYGLSNLNGGNKYEVITPENTLISYEPDNSRMFSYAGLLQSNTMKGKHVNLFSAGLKLRFTFCLGKRRIAMFGGRTVHYKGAEYSSSASIL